MNIKEISEQADHPQNRQRMTTQRPALACTAKLETTTDDLRLSWSCLTVIHTIQSFLKLSFSYSFLFPSSALAIEEFEREFLEKVEGEFEVHTF